MAAEYWQVDVIVDGALDSMDECETWAEVEAIIAKVEADAAEDGLLTEVYLLHHGHENDGEECACASYTTDHYPYVTFNVEG